MKILLPVDGSDCSKKTIAWAGCFLDKAHTQIYLLNVIELPTGVPPIDLDIAKAHRVLHEARQILENKGYQVEKLDFVMDSPASAICQYAENEDIDQIIIGSHGKQGFAKFLMGSVSEAVFKHAKRPVLVFKNDENATIQISHIKQVSLSEASCQNS